MHNTRLGQTDLEVSRLALGTWSFGGEWGSFDEDEARATIHRALDLGVTLFDTAQAYGFGVAERLLGTALTEAVRREDVVIATEGGLRPDGGTLHRDTGADWLRAGVESSLRNLGTDYIDIYQVHWPDPHTSAEETAGVLEDLVREGKIRHIGVSNYDTKQLDELARYARVETLQPPFHMFHRDIETEILPYAEANDMGVLVYGPLAHGMLAGRMTPETTFPDDDWRSHSADFTGANFARNLEVVQCLEEFARTLDLPLPQLAVTWATSHPGVDVAIVGARRPSQLEAVLPAGDIELSTTELDAVDGILADAVRMAGPSPEGM